LQNQLFFLKSQDNNPKIKIW